MTKWLLAALVAANVLFLGYTQGWFDGLFGLDSLGGREPARLAAQVRPETVLLLRLPASGASAARPASRCLEAGPFTPGDLAAAEATLRAAVPEGGWRIVGPAGGAPADAAAAATLRIDAAEPDLAARLADVRLGPAARSFSPCP